MVGLYINNHMPGTALVMRVFVSVDGHSLPGTIVESNVSGAFARPYQTPVDAIRLDTGELVYACMAPGGPCVAQSQMNPVSEKFDRSLEGVEGVFDRAIRAAGFEELLSSYGFSTEQITWITTAIGYDDLSDDEVVQPSDFDADFIWGASMNLIQELHDVPEEAYFTFFVMWAKFCADYTQTQRSSETDIGIFVNFMKTYNQTSLTKYDSMIETVKQLNDEEEVFQRKAAEFLNLKYSSRRKLMDLWRTLEAMLNALNYHEKFNQDTTHAKRQKM